MHNYFVHASTCMEWQSKMLELCCNCKQCELREETLFEDAFVRVSPLSLTCEAKMCIGQKWSETILDEKKNVEK